MGEQMPVALEDNLVRGLVDRLPVPGTAWPAASRLRWIEAAGFILALVYRDEEPGVSGEVSEVAESQAGPAPLPGEDPQAGTAALPRAIPAPSSPIAAVKKSRGLSAAQVLRAAPKGPGRPAGELEAAVLAALDAGGTLSVREVMSWLERHRKELALSKSNLYSCVWSVLQRLERAGVVADGDRDGVRVFSKA